MNTNIINFNNVAKVIANGKTISKILIAQEYQERRTLWEYQFGPNNPSILTFTAEEPNSKISLVGNSSYNVKLAYSLNNLPWKEYTIGTVLDLNKDEYVFFKALEDVGGFSSSIGYYRFQMEGKISASGNVMWLVDPTGESKTIPCEKCFQNLFSGCSTLTTAPELPATTLASYCYGGMFSGCRSLSAAPQLPATQLASYCYHIMFKSCSSLLAAPRLPATQLTEGCYYHMFNNCTSLTAAPQLPATQLADYCYNGMFFGCSSLKISNTEKPDGIKILDIPIGTEAKANWNAGMFYATGGTFKGNPEIGKAYWQY